MPKIAVIFHSGYGHTQRMAEAVAAGAGSVASTELIAIDTEGNITDAAWATLAAADAVVMGSPTYMGSVSWQFKKFADASSKVWFSMGWKDKIAAGFTNSASMNGDKHSTLHYLFTLSQQHGMVWVGTGMMPASTKATERDALNYLGSSAGAMAQSPSDAGVDEMPVGDLETAKQFGARVATMAARFNK